MAMFGQLPAMKFDLLQAAGAAPQMQPRNRGFFGRNGAGRAIAGSIGDLLLQQAGAAPIYAPAMENKLRQRMQELGEERDEARYQRRLSDQLKYQQAYGGEPQAPAAGQYPGLDGPLDYGAGGLVGPRF